MLELRAPQPPCRPCPRPTNNNVLDGSGTEFRAAMSAHARADGDLALNSAPTSLPRRHVTEAKYTGPPFDNDKRKLSGMLSGSTTLRRTLLREISSTRHCWVANEPACRIFAVMLSRRESARSRKFFAKSKLMKAPSHPRSVLRRPLSPRFPNPGFRRS